MDENPTNEVLDLKFLIERNLREQHIAFDVLLDKAHILQMKNGGSKAVSDMASTMLLHKTNIEALLAEMMNIRVLMLAPND